ncbi:DUF2790 domain-containing protein [Pseudomonas sp. 148P]|uniref:DUF2790 domain-containing protein n=1 Tax=Pseudomonas ulcerans TaxID=3115852 RepID=A0ABU7HTJ9_9PSED|nr:MULTISPECIES: DUF2790 domain-containing protein [unclassified Pseudomonas]MEE1923794.1 DUF2790 domain-containing protein [Pseudomonas sp. 147P]MEE1934872.1 DUF2790 domain-containing protein [Pseudomonas sp. 148P]
MKTLVAVALLAVSSFALAEQAPATTQPAPEQYSYGADLDIAKVISLSKVPNVCEVVPATMVYEDHQGQRHTVEYRVMGDGCSQG